MTRRPTSRARRALHAGRSRIRRYPALVRSGVYLGRLAIAFWHKFVDDDCLGAAASLAYTTILAVVPLLVVSFLLFRVSGTFGDIEGKVRGWLLANLLAESVEPVTAYLNMFLTRVTAGAVSVTGIALLVFTATWLFVTAEGTLNRIWRVTRRRSLVARFTTFWAILSLGPVLIGVGFYLSSMFDRTALGQGLRSLPWLQALLAVVLPLCLSVAALTLIYRLVPNTRVRWVPALSGGLVAGLLFELSKFGFNVYVVKIYSGSTTVRIYGAFALFPVFLLWLYVVWLVTLFGAVVAYSIQNLDVYYDDEFQRRVPEERARAALSPYLACRALLLVAHRHFHGAPPLTQEHLVRALRAPERAIYAALKRLEDGGVLLSVDRSGEPVYVPARDIGGITLEDALEAYYAASLGPDPDRPAPEARALDDLFCDLQLQRREVSADISFRDLVATIPEGAVEALFASGPAEVVPELEAKAPPAPLRREAKRMDSAVLSAAGKRSSPTAKGED